MITKFGGRQAVARGVAIQPNGRIVVAGEAGGKAALARYRKSGKLDGSFSGNGKKLTRFAPNTADQAADVALTPDGRIVTVGGTEASLNDTKFLITRHRPSGKLDRTFSRDGKRKVSFPGDCCSFAAGVAIQTNGRIVGAGSSSGRIALVRLNQNGKLDDSFAGNGRKRTEFPGPGVSGRDVALQDDGRIVAAGRTGSGFAVARYRKGGTLDGSFSEDGRQTTDIGSANAVAIQADAKIVAAGLTGDPEHDFALARYLTNGELDN